MNAAADRLCPVCDEAMRGPRARWRYDCPACGFQSAAFDGEVDSAATTSLDEADREIGLETLRRANFERILDRLDPLVTRESRRLLDVGCAHGWFLDAAARRGYRVLGVEPDRRIGELAARHGHDVAFGYFPQALRAEVRYDVIVFNDVFEHVPQPRAAMAAVRRFLVPGGLLVINLPSSRGIFYRVADALRRMGWSGPHDRLWQAGFPSPHISYFHPGALARLASREGFVEVHRSTLPAVERDGLWQRLRYANGSSVTVSLAAWTAIVLGAPMLEHLPADISLQMFRAAQ